jgi:hypothetical protein
MSVAEDISNLGGRHPGKLWKLDHKYGGLMSAAFCLPRGGLMVARSTLYVETLHPGLDGAESAQLVFTLFGA